MEFRAVGSTVRRQTGLILAGRDLGLRFQEKVGCALVGDFLLKMESKLSIEIFLREPSAEEAFVPAHDSTSLQASDWPRDSFLRK
jgi:hypothetical protein